MGPRSNIVFKNVPPLWFFVPQLRNPGDEPDLTAWVAEPFSKWGWGTSPSQKNVEKFCGLNYKLWRHQHRNMTSLTFFSMFKQFCAMFYKPSQHPLSIVHPLSTYDTLTWEHKCNQLFLILHKIHSQVRTNTTCTKLRNVLILHHQIGSSFYTIWRSKLHYFRQNYTTMKSEPPEIEIGCYRGDSRSTASLGLWFWLALSLLCDVNYVIVNAKLSW